MNTYEAARREMKKRWSFPVKAWVTHPNHYPVLVPCASNFSAILCAAETWRVDYRTVMDAKVMWCEEQKTEKRRRDKNDNQ